MNKIEVRILQSPPVSPCAMTTLAASITQKKISNYADLLELLVYNPKLVKRVQTMKHDSITRHSNWTLAIIGASRRFLAQITRHHVGTDFTSGSLQYIDMRGHFDPVVPYPVIERAVLDNDKLVIHTYKQMCEDSFNNYDLMMQMGMDNDTAGYVSCQASRNVLIITGNTEAWRNVIRQRVCNRNTLETQFVALKIWEALYNDLDGDVMFDNAGPDCRLHGYCSQGKMSCRKLSLFCQTLTEEVIEGLFEQRFPAIKKLEEIS